MPKATSARITRSHTRLGKPKRRALHRAIHRAVQSPPSTGTGVKEVDDASKAKAKDNELARETEELAHANHMYEACSAVAAMHDKYAKSFREQASEYQATVHRIFLYRKQRSFEESMNKHFDPISTSIDRLVQMLGC